VHRVRIGSAIHNVKAMLLSSVAFSSGSGWTAPHPCGRCRIFSRGSTMGILYAEYNYMHRREKLWCNVEHQGRMSQLLRRIRCCTVFAEAVPFTMLRQYFLVRLIFQVVWGGLHPIRGEGVENISRDSTMGILHDAYK
jgi:hypothetical protein